MNRFTRAAAVVAAAPLLALGFAGAASAHTVPTAHPDGTPSCGATCLNVSNELYGPAQVINGKASGKVTLRHASNAYSFEDLVLYWYGTVRQAEHDGIITKTSYAYVNYPHHYAAEFAFAPLGVVNSSACIGVASAAFSGEAVTKQRCGLSAKTLWVFDPEHAEGAPSFCLAPSTYCPVFNGSDANFSVAEALTATSATGPLQVRDEQLFSSTSEAEDAQQWEYNEGVTP